LYGMDRLTRIRLTLGPARPFILGKLMDRLRLGRADRELRVRAAVGSTYTRPSTLWNLKAGLAAIPPASWIGIHGPAILAHAEEIARHRFDILGSGPYTSAAPRWWWDGPTAAIHADTIADARERAAELPDGHLPLDWTLDPIHAHRFDAMAWYADVKVVVQGADFKLPHEFGRGHQWPVCALAAIVEPERRDHWHDVLRSQIIDFIASCPPQYGPQWTVATGPGIRIYNMLLAWDWARQSGMDDDGLEAWVAASVVDHAEHIMATREWSGGMRNSHYLANLFGLVACGLYLDGHADTRAWLAFAVAELDRELRIQFLDDGGNFEASTGYHRHCIDFVEHVTALLDAAFVGDDTIPRPGPVWRRRLDAARRFLAAVTPNPLIGDNDDGMGVMLPDMLTIPAREPFMHFPDFGLTVWHRPSFRLTARCGPIGQHGKGGHAHNDQNSITLRVDDEDVLIDAGTFTYGADPRRRNEDRSTAVHSTLVVQGLEQNDWPDDSVEGLFWMMGDRAKGTILSASATTWDAVHRGYDRPHSRQLVVTDDMIDGADRYDGRHDAWVCFHIAPAVGIDIHADKVLLKGRTCTVELTWNGGAVDTVPSSCAPGYGRTLPTTIVRLHLDGPSMMWRLRILG